MDICLRIINIGMLFSIALFFTIVTFDNVIDYNSNWEFVKHVLSMDTTFKEPVLMSRAITHVNIQRFFYHCIILVEGLTAILCWLGCLLMLLKINKHSQEFNRSKLLGFMGLFIGFMLYMVGFMIIGGEWFSMWQSSVWNMQAKAGLFISLIMFVMIFMKIS